LLASWIDLYFVYVLVKHSRTQIKHQETNQSSLII